jgi:hypothetical protein
MQISTIDNGDGTVEVRANYYDEGIPVGGKTTVIGTEREARAYGAHFAADLRAANADKFPRPAPTTEEEI